MQSVMKKYTEAINEHKEIAAVLENQFMPVLRTKTPAEFAQFTLTALPVRMANHRIAHESIGLIKGLTSHPHKEGIVRCHIADVLKALNKSPSEKALLIFSNAPFAAIVSRTSLESQAWRVWAANAHGVSFETYFADMKSVEVGVYFYLSAGLKIKLNGIPERPDFAEVTASTELAHLPITPIARDGDKVYVAAKIPTVDRRTLSNLDEEIANLPREWPDFNVKALAGMVMYKRTKREEILAISETKIFVLTGNELNVSTGLDAISIDVLIKENETCVELGAKPSAQAVVDIARLLY